MIPISIAALAMCLFAVDSDASDCKSYITNAKKGDCAEGERDDGTSCWLDSYGRGAGRVPDKSPCPDGLRDDGTSCWSDAHIYGKGCCCTLWGCCNQCKTGYHDDGCTCRKTDVGIKLTLFQRQSCRDDEEMYGSLCYPKCKSGYNAVGCCICEPDGGPRITQTLFQRSECPEGTKVFLTFCVRVEECTRQEVEVIVKVQYEWQDEYSDLLGKLYQ